MKPTTKTLITTLLLFFITTGIMAQEKYEIAIVTLHNNSVSVEKHTFENFPFCRTCDMEAEGIKKIEEMSKDGWEIINATITPSGYHVFYLKRKLKD